MAHHLSEGDVRLAGLPELRPDLGDRLVIVDKAALHRMRDQQAHHRLAGGKDGGQSLAGEGPGPRGVGVTGPKIDGQFTVDAD